MAEYKYALEAKTDELSRRLTEAQSAVAKLEDDKNKIYESYEQQIGALTSLCYHQLPEQIEALTRAKQENCRKRGPSECQCSSVTARSSA